MISLKSSYLTAVGIGITFPPKQLRHVSIGFFEIFLKDLFTYLKERVFKGRVRGRERESQADFLLISETDLGQGWEGGGHGGI